MTDPTPVAFFNEAAREAAARAAWSENTSRPWSWDDAPKARKDDFRAGADAALNAALEALPERSKAILALAALSDEELVEEFASALAQANGYNPNSVPVAKWSRIRDAYCAEADAILTALGLPVAEREATG